MSGDARMHHCSTAIARHLVKHATMLFRMLTPALLSIAHGNGGSRTDDIHGIAEPAARERNGDAPPKLALQPDMECSL